jgi:tetratricopeptide (TPR) repeat protein
MEDNKIKTYGVELVLMGVVAFFAIISLTIITYKIFIKERVKNSEEYSTATYFVVNSQTLKDHLLSPMQSMSFDDLMVSERETHGICEITFHLTLKNKLTETLKVGMVKIADFWVVYEAVLSPKMPSEYYLVSTYQKILGLLERLDFQDHKTAMLYFELIKKETRNPNLLDYLNARVNAIAGNSTHSDQLLRDLGDRIKYSKLAVLLERGMVFYDSEDYKKAIEHFEAIKKEYDDYKDKTKKQTGKSIFAGLPKDPFIATFAHDNVLAESYKMLSESYRKSGRFDKGLEYAELAIEQANKISSKVTRSAAMLVKAYSLFDLNRYKEADEAFKDVINDVGNPNLTQKSWAWYHRAIIASAFRRHEDALDYYETAVSLDPFNHTFRKGIIEYLIERNYVGDLEVALGFSLRGIDYEAQKQYFKEMASRLYLRLGQEDKTKYMN